jgi:hypothetical protein
MDERFFGDRDMETPVLETDEQSARGWILSPAKNRYDRIEAPMG